MLSLSTSTNVEIGVVDFGGTLGEVKVNVNVLGELQKLVDGCLPLIPLMVSWDFNKGEPFFKKKLLKIYYYYNII